MGEAEELVEAVARAIYEADDPWHKAWPWGQSRDGIEDKVRDIARAAIPVVLKAVADVLPDDLDLFRAIRGAGRKDRDKARAVLAILPNMSATIELLTKHAGEKP